MSEYVSNFVTLTEEELQPAAPQPATKLPPLHIIMTPDIRTGNVLALPGGYLPEGVRGRNAIIANAAHILRTCGIKFTPSAEGFVSGDDTREHGFGFVVEPATHTPIHSYYDLTGIERHEMVPASPQPNPNAPLELHHWSRLLQRTQSLNYRRTQLIQQGRIDREQTPPLHGQEAFLRAFGRRVANYSAR